MAQIRLSGEILADVKWDVAGHPVLYLFVGNDQVRIADVTMDDVEQAGRTLIDEAQAERARQRQLRGEGLVVRTVAYNKDAAVFEEVSQSAVPTVDVEEVKR